MVTAREIGRLREANALASGLPPGAIAVMLMLCVSWGFNQLAVKLALPDVPPMLQAMIRSMGALPVLFLIGTFRGVKFFENDGTWRPGLIAGLMFGIEFVLIFQGLRLTSASRAVNGLGPVARAAATSSGSSTRAIESACASVLPTSAKLGGRRTP